MVVRRGAGGSLRADVLVLQPATIASRYGDRRVQTHLFIPSDARPEHRQSVGPLPDRPQQPSHDMDASLFGRVAYVNFSQEIASRSARFLRIRNNIRVR